MNKAPLIPIIAALAAVQFGCGSDGHAPTTEANTASDGHVSSSIADGAQLSAPVRWTARVTGVDPDRVASVRFLIDGKLAHVERKTPYDFAGLRNVLIPGTLGRGSHTFAVDARLAGGGRLTAASSATVSESAQGVPPAVVGRWKRTVKAAEVRRTEDFRNLGPGEVPLPVGTWKLRIGADGVARYIDPTPEHGLTVGQVRLERGGRLVVGNEIPNLPQAEGYFCPDTVGTGRYRWSLEAKALVVKAVDDRECADRNSFWNGRFTR
jgi:hypothetical protein